MDPQERYDRLFAVAFAEYGLVIEKKHTMWYWRAMRTLLTVLTFGQVEFYHVYTTIGNRIGVSAAWDNLYIGDKYEILLHEIEHIKQYKTAGFGNIWLGQVIAGFGYLFLPFPVGFAWVRTKMEMAGYAQSMRAIVQVYGADTARSDKARIVSQFTSINYLYMWPFKGHIERWFDSTLAKIIEEEGP